MQVLTLSVGALGTNCYIVSRSDNAPAIVIDPGDDANVILQTLQSHGLQLASILLTHGHFDHFGALDALIAATGCDFYISKEDSLMIRDGVKNFSVSFFGRTIESCTLARVVLEDGMQLQLADLMVDVIATPGHSLGSVCYRIEDCLFTGDTLFRGACGRVDGYGGSGKSILRSLAMLRTIDENLTVYPGHGESTSLGYEKEYNMYMKLKHVLND